MNENRSLYFVAVIPPEPLREQVTKIKLEFAEKYQSRHGLKSPPHITIIPPFTAPVQNENEIIDLLESYIQDQESFEIKVKGYGAFKPRVIFLDIEDKSALVAIEKGLADQFNAFTWYERRISKLFNPHLTLAHRDLSPQMFRKAWNKYKLESYKASFTVNRLYLLKHNGKFWDIHNEILFDAS